MQQELLDWLLVHYGQEQMRPGLERMNKALKSLLPKFENSKIVIIAGTNGKGETSLRLSELLHHKSHNVWISPHIERITERFKNENGEIEFDHLKQLIQECHQLAQDEGFELSFYEFLFLVFCTWAAQNPPEYLLLEVGLGGRLDAVNVFDADLVLLPSISRDHQEILGSRYDQILFEKLGTLRPQSTLIHFLESSYLVDRAKAYAEAIGARIVSLKDRVSLPVYEFSLRNKALASAAYCSLMSISFAPNEWKGPVTSLEHRGEVRLGKNDWFFYGSHNVDGVRKLIQFLHSGTYNFSRPPYDSVIVAFSRRNLLDLRHMMRMLKAAQIGKIVVTVFNHPKAATSETMEVLSREEGLTFVQDIDSYIQERPQGQRVLVTGSYYFLGHFKSLSCCR
jgi:dihydrofolate synthase/folylpolyglutamate synthase